LPAPIPNCFLQLLSRNRPRASIKLVQGCHARIALADVEQGALKPKRIFHL
jgi:hypothetical protein